MKQSLFSLILITILFSQNLSPAMLQQATQLSQSQVKSILQQTGHGDVVQGNNAGTSNTVTQKQALQESGDLSVTENQGGAEKLPQEIYSEGDAFFGESFFKNFKIKPNTYGPVPENYVLGTGDEIIITLYGEVQEFYELTIDREGAIVPKDVGRIILTNTKFKEAKEVIKKAFQRVHNSIKSGKTLVHTTIGKQRRVHVNVMGEVRFPRNMNLSALNTVFDAIVMAGGPTENAALRHVQVRRGSDVFNYDLYYDMVPALRTSNNFKLENGDMIIIGANKEAVRISGAVRQPSSYEIGNETRVDDIITIAGGLKYTASIDYATITTLVNEEEVVLNFPNPEALRQYILKDGDGIVIKTRNVVDSSYVEIRGSVLYPGRYAHQNGMSAKDLINRSGGAVKNTFKKRFDFLRKINKKEYESFTVEEKDLDSLQLKVGDVIRLYNELEFIETREITIISFAQGTKTFQYYENSDIYDYLSRIGGLKFVEDKSFVEVVRLTGEKDPNKYAVLFDVPINKDYLDHSKTSEKEFKMQPDDIIIIRKDPDIEPYQTVKVLGEVYSAGSYPLIQRDERLSDLITRAKGFKPTAYIEGIQFYRMINDTNSVRIPVDFIKVLKDPMSEENIFIKDGDEIKVPKNPYVVFVRGDVVTPTAVIYKKGATVHYYISQAGGITEEGDDTRVQVIKANGKQFNDGLFISDEITAGSLIMVPKRRKVEENSPKEILQTVFGYLSSIVTSLVLLRQL